MQVDLVAPILAKREIPAPRPTLSLHIVTLLLFTALAVVLNWPIPAQLGEVFLTPTGDFGHGYWNFWWAAQALGSGQDPLTCTHIFHDEGASLVWGNFPVLLTYVAAPITWIWGAAVSYNVLFLMSFVLAGWGAYLLAHYLTGYWLAGLAAGLIFGFSPWNVLTYPNITYCHTEWLPFLLLFLLRLRDTGKHRYAIGAGCMLAFSFLTSPYYGVYNGLVAAFIAVTTFVGGCPAKRGIWLRGLLLTFLCMMALSAYRAVPMILQALGDDIQIEEVVPRTQADLVGLKVRTDPDALVQPLRLISWPALYGYFAVVGAALALVFQRIQRTLGWVLLGIFFFLLSLGPDLNLAGRRYGAFLPADALAKLPFLGALRGYEKAQSIALLCVAILCAWAFARLLKTGRPGIYSACLILALMIAEYWAPARVPRGEVVPSFYYELAEEPAEQAVLFIPFDPAVSDRSMMRPMFMQTVHEKPLITGHYSSRFDPAHRKRLSKVPVLAQLMAGNRSAVGQVLEEPSAMAAEVFRRQLLELEIGVVVLQTQLIRTEGTFAEGRQPVGLEKNWAEFLTPVWWGPLATDLIYPPARKGLEFFAPPRQQWLHPSVEPFLEAILGAPDKILEDGAKAWILDPA